MTELVILLCLAIAAAAALYASVGHGGASAYIALMALAGFSPYLVYRFLSFVGVDLYNQIGAEQEAKSAVNRPVPSKLSVPVASWNSPVPPLTSASGTVAVYVHAPGAVFSNETVTTCAAPTAS